MTDEPSELRAPSESPEESGTSQDQRTSQVIDANLVVDNARRPAPLSDTFHQIASASNQNAKTAYMLAGAGTRLIETDIRELKEKLHETEQKLEESNKNYYSERERRRVLEAHHSVSDITTVILSLGFLLLGAALSIYINIYFSQAAPAFSWAAANTLAIIGSVIVIVALLVPSLRKPSE